MCISSIFIDYPYRSTGALDQIMEICEAMARERRLEYIGFKLEAKTHGFDALCRIAEELDFERVTVQPEYILFLRKV